MKTVVKIILFVLSLCENINGNKLTIKDVKGLASYAQYLTQKIEAVAAVRPHATSVVRPALLTEEECLLIEAMEHTRLFKTAITRDATLQNVMVDYAWFIHNNQPSAPEKAKLDRWFKHPLMQRALQEDSLYYQDLSMWMEKLTPEEKARKLGFATMPNSRFMPTPDDQSFLKYMSPLAAVGRVCTRNAMQEIIDTHGLDSIKVPTKSIYLERHASLDRSVYVIAQKFDLRSKCADWKSAHTETHQQWDVFVQQCNARNIRLDLLADNVTYHTDTHHRLGGYTVIIDTEGSSDHIPRAPTDVVRFYRDWKAWQFTRQQLQRR